MSPESIATLRAAIDRLIPRDDFPGATEAGVDRYIIQLLAGDRAGESPRIEQALRAIDAEARATRGKHFDQLPPGAQDDILAAVENGRVASAIWIDLDPRALFDRLVELCAEGYYSDPEQGGNRDGVSWRMIGYDRRAPRPAPRS